MRTSYAALCCAAAMVMSGCGGSGGDTAEPAPTPLLRIGAAAGDTGRAASGIVHDHRIEVRNAGNASALAVNVAVSLDAQALQLPLACEASNCTARSDGSIDIAEIPAGGAVVLRQRLRVKPGYRGPVANDWQASSAGGNARWQQSLTAYAVDVSVTVGEPTGASTTRSYEVTLTNAGPDEATDVSWDLLTMPLQTWRVTGCTASTGASCPTALGEAMTLARVPAGGTVNVTVQVEEPADMRTQGLATRAVAAGDTDPGNDQAAARLFHGEHLFMSDLEGRQYRLSYSLFGPLRATAAGVDYRTDYAVDFTGQGTIGDPSAVNPPWGRGTINFWGPVMVLGLDIDGARKSYVAPTRLVSQLGELEGVTFNVLGSRADGAGKPVDAYAGSARFKDGALQLCLPDSPTPFDQCPAAKLSRFEAAFVGSEIELVSKDKVLRIRAARSADGPILISSSRQETSGISEFWVALPNDARYPFDTYRSNELHETTFESASGLSSATLASIGSDADRMPKVAPSIGLPNALLQYVNTTGKLGVCGLTAQLSSSTQPNLFEGTLRGDWLPGSFENGQFVKERPCFAGSVLHAQTYRFAAFLGARGGDLMGRWMFAGAN